ncbi:phosphate ABC transporter permease subunit PstC [Enterococcus hirae]|nr:phosphate ABC transporter permease subunit PstC [Enterococcus hirae]
MFMTMEKVCRRLFLFSALASIVALGVISLFLVLNSLPAFQKVGIRAILTGTVWQPSSQLFGILPMIMGSLYVTLGALLIGGPLGLFGAIFLAFFCPKKIYPLFKQMINLMAGIPSIVYGFFGLVVLVPLIQPANGSGKGIITASLLLGIMILPTIITVAEDALQAVPKSYYEGSTALGATHERTIFRVMLPAAKSGIFAAIVLGLGRAIGETMAVMMVAGNQAIFPHSLFSGVRTLTTNIVLEMGYAAGLHRQMLIATAVVLFLIILVLNFGLGRLKERGINDGSR